MVTELGAANLSMGLIGLLSLLHPSWITPAAVAGGLFLAIAGVKHLMNTPRNNKENFAMATDFVVALAVGIYLIYG